ncbi:MAG: hypothetical protein J1D77_05640 [Muribaculaceae bacterium]|nr:hypothetical protein [Muribaculaceae bacterium]
MKFIHNIKKFIIPRKSAFAALPAICLAAGSLLSSCVAEDLPDCPDNTPDLPGSEYLLSFKISLPTLGNSSRISDHSILDETYDNYIDPTRMYILFFIEGDFTEGGEDNSEVIEGEDGNGENSGAEGLRSRLSSKDVYSNYKLFHKFTVKDPAVSMIPVAYANDVEKERAGQKDWYVRIAIPKVVNGEKFAQTLRENRFRIAVVANAEPDKVLKIEVGDDINVLHHQTDQTDPYASSDNAKLTYDFLYSSNPNNKYNKVLGYYTDWVESNNAFFTSEETTRIWLRNNWDPEQESRWNDGDGKPYVNLWSLWNFSGTDYRDFFEGYEEEIPDPNNEGSKITRPGEYTVYIDKWARRNGKVISKWMSEENATTKLLDLTDEDYTDSEIAEPTPLYFKTIDGAKTVTDGTMKAVKLPEANAGDFDSNDKIKESGKGYFKFHANATGNLFITAKHGHDSSLGGTKNESSITLVAQIGNSKKFQNYTFKYRNDNGDPNGIQTISKKIQITTASQDVYIYIRPKDGNSLDIYQIEFIQDKYLYDTDRTGIAPSNEQPIPMYGIQSYEPLGNLWEVGTTFDLDNYNYISNDYNDVADPTKTYFHPIYMLRSVAKIEIKIPTSLESHHVYLRSLNRYARWEPADVVSNTNEIWTKGHDALSGQDYLKRDYCEWFNIQNQGVFYNPETQNLDKIIGKDDEDNDIVTGRPQLDVYKKKLAWYYGTWAKNGQLGGVTPEQTVDVTNEFDYPHIMNALVGRSDFCRFIPAGHEGIYDRYVLYVGEKYIDDPDSKDLGGAVETSSPKICHIEFRTKDDPYVNMDDDQCYRVYFTKDGVYGTPPSLIDDDHGWETQYENKPEILKEHWPILRNHYYSFTVKDIDNKVVIVALEVLPWRQVDDISISW